MNYPRNPSRRCEDRIQIAFPLRRILPGTVAGDGGPGEYAFNPSSQPTGRLSFLKPNGPENVENMLKLDIFDRH